MSDKSERCSNGNCAIKETCARFVVTHGTKEAMSYPRHSCRRGICEHHQPLDGGDHARA